MIANSYGTKKEEEEGSVDGKEEDKKEEKDEEKGKANQDSEDDGGEGVCEESGQRQGPRLKVKGKYGAKRCRGSFQIFPDGTFTFLADPVKHRRPGWPLTGSGGKEFKEAGSVTCPGKGVTAGCRVQEAALPSRPANKGGIRVGMPTGMLPTLIKSAMVHVRQEWAPQKCRCMCQSRGYPSPHCRNSLRLSPEGG